MKKGKYYSIGYETGQDIAQTNVHEYDLSDERGRDKFMSEMSETESEHYRQFSPFEFLASEMNQWESRWNQDGLLWTAYENGVHDGIQSVIDENIPDDTESTDDKQ